MNTWAIVYHSPQCYILRGDITEVFSDYASLIRYMKEQEGEHRIHDIPCEGVIELYFGIVTKLDTHNGRHDAWLKEQWAIIV